MKIGHRRLIGTTAKTQVLLELTTVTSLLGKDHRHHVTAGARPSGTARSMQVGLVIFRRIEVDHTFDSSHMNSAGGHVSGHHRAHVAAGEVPQGPIPTTLR